MMLVRVASFRQRLAAGHPLIGTFQRTASGTVTEILALSGLDCVCLDAEHAPLDRAALDCLILAARAHDLPSLVRVADPTPAHILTALDLGATGIIVPHVASAEDALNIVRASRYGREGRGYSGATRAAGFTTRAMATVIAEANATACVVAQIEDEAALGRIDEIAAVEGIDCLFIGRMDLTVSMGAATPDDTRVVGAVKHICTVARRHGCPVGMFTPTTEEALQWRSAGISFFLLASDHQWVLQGARELVSAFRPT